MFGILMVALLSSASAMDGWAEYGNVGSESSNGGQYAASDVEFTYSDFTGLGAEAYGDANFAAADASGVIDNYAPGYIEADTYAVDYYSGDTAQTSAYADDYTTGWGAGLDVGQYADASYDYAGAGQSGWAYGDYAEMDTSSSTGVSYASTYAGTDYGFVEGSQGTWSGAGDSSVGQSMWAVGDYSYLYAYAGEADGNEAGVEAYSWGYSDILTDQGATASYIGYWADAGQWVDGYGDVETFTYAYDTWSDTYAYCGTYNWNGYSSVESYSYADSWNGESSANEMAYLDGYSWFGADSYAESYSSWDYAYADYYNGIVAFTGTGAYADWTGYADAWVF